MTWFNAISESGGRYSRWLCYINCAAATAADGVIAVRLHVGLYPVSYQCELVVVAISSHSTGASLHYRQVSTQLKNLREVD